MRFDEPAKIREMRELALAAQQQPAELILELLDCARQGRLRHIAELCRPREVQRVRYRQEVADLMHFHAGKLPRFAISHKSQQRECSLRPHNKPRASKLSPTGISVDRAAPLPLPRIVITPMASRCSSMAA